MNLQQDIEREIEEAISKFDMAKASAGKAQSVSDWLRQSLTRIAKEAEEQERERCAVKAWSTGMDLGIVMMEAREVGAKCAKAIRALTSDKEK